MKKYLFAPLFMLVLAFSVQAAQPNLDQLLTDIKADIAAKRLSTPAGNNALEKIRTFRQAAPFDFRVSPLIYDWAKIYVEMANTAIAEKNYAKAQGYLDIVWPVAALTPGLESAQEKIDQNYKGQAVVASNAPTAADLERQRKAAAEAAAEKARVEAEHKKQQEEQRLQAELAKKQAAEDLIKRQQQEREKRLAAERAAAQAAAEQATAKPAASKAAAPVTAPAAKAAAPVVAAPVVSAPVVALSTNKAAKIWAQAEEDSAPIASYPLNASHLKNRDRDAVEKTLTPICRAIVENDASVVVHTEDKGAYRWLTVRLTVCLRNESKEFRLRHSHQTDTNDGEPYITLHPARDVSLIKQVNEG